MTTKGSVKWQFTNTGNHYLILPETIKKIGVGFIKTERSFISV
jgi:hypothetical protein